MLSRFATLGGGGDPYWDNVSYLLVGNGANGTTTNIVDSSKNNLATTINGNTVISTAKSKFGSGSVYFDGSGDSLSLPDSSLLELGSSSFTIDFWINASTSTQYSTVYSRSPAAFAAGSWTLLFNFTTATSGDIAFFCGDYSLASGLLLTSGININDGAWHFIALVRNGSSWVLYVDGVSYATNTWSGTITDLASGPRIGNDQFYARDLLGYIYDFRHTKGVARYTANYTPPPFPPTSAMPTFGP
jgi:hypothetical protein